MEEIKVGDRVRVTVEAEVGWVSARTPGRFHIYLGGNEVAIERPGVKGITVEKIEPPVETFGPGDLVRHKTTGSYWYLATNGYVRMASAEFPNAVQFYGHEDAFTSEEYERVSLD